MYIVYIYDHNNNLLTQVFNIFQLKINKKLNDISTASFSITQKLWFNFLKFWNKIKIVKEIKWEEKTMFEWIIKLVEAEIDKTTITCSSYEYILSRRMILEDKTYNNKKIKEIVEDIFNYMNNIYNTGLNVVCKNTTIITKTWNKNTTILQILKDLVAFDVNFLHKWTTFYVDKLVGLDRTSGENYLEFYLNKEDFARSIAKIKTTINLDNLANVVITDNGNTEDTGSIQEFGRWEINEFDADANSLLQEKAYWVKEIEITPSINDYFAVDIWDKVAVKVFVDNELLDYEWTMLVLEKNLQGGDLEKIDLKLSNTKEKTKTLLEKIKQMDEDIYKLKI